ncbi:MAG TPA: DUF5658 family protein [Pyrinomonadaceae bacterium]|nr:DUF5658 family protein [Pyrinomonadaceae bacterium]
MGALSKSCLLFVLNGLDAQLTVLWVRLNVASEGNALMARVLEHGELSFLGAKVAIGAIAAFILYRCAHLPIAKHGLTVVLGIYAILMLIHAATGCVALGWQGPITFLGYVENLPHAFLSLFV